MELWASRGPGESPVGDEDLSGSLSWMLRCCDATSRSGFANQRLASCLFHPPGGSLGGTKQVSLVGKAVGGTVTLNNIAYKPEIVLPGREGGTRDSSGRGLHPHTKADHRCRNEDAHPPPTEVAEVGPEPALLCWSQEADLHPRFFLRAPGGAWGFPG